MSNNTPLWDVEMVCHGGWAGTFGCAVRTVIEDLLPEGPFTAEVGLEDGQVVTGELTAFTRGADGAFDTLTVNGQSLPLNKVYTFRF